MKKSVNASLLALLLLSIAVSSCQDSPHDHVEPSTQNDLNVEGVVKIQEYVFNDQTYRLSHYIEGDTTKKFIKNEDYLSLTNQLDGKLKSVHIKVDRNSNATYHIYNSSKELYAKNPNIEARMSEKDNPQSNGRVAHTGSLHVIGWDHKNYGGAVRLSTDCNVTECVFLDLGAGCQIFPVPGYTASCKNNDISSLFIYNFAKITGFVSFHDGKNLSTSGHNFTVELAPGGQWADWDLKLLPSSQSQSGSSSTNWRNRISSVRVF